MDHPYADLIDLKLEPHQEEGQSTCSVVVHKRLFNTHRVVHGGVLYALADTGMGAAVYPSLKPDETCATIEIKINYFRPVTSGTIQCTSKVIHRGKRIANMESCLYVDDQLVAKANGSYSIFEKS